MKKELNAKQKETLIATLKLRFEKNKKRHEGMDWSLVADKLAACNPQKLWSLNEMETTGGEPDVIGVDKQTNEVIFFDCAAESPKERRSFCYDNAALEARKENKPKNSALGLAAEIGIEILTEDEYQFLQTTGEYDVKTSSWVKTPDAVRKLGGAIFCDRRFGRVFTYHNGAESYYAGRAFRGSLRV